MTSAHTPPGTDRETEIVGTLRSIAGRVLRIEPQDLNPDAPFLAFGADSLALVEMLRALHERFGVTLTVRQLFEDYPTISALAGHLLRVAPPPRDPPPSAKRAPSRAPARPPPPAPPRPPLDSPRRPASRGDAASPALTRVLDAQLRAFQQLADRQLEMLRGRGPAPAEAEPSEVARPRAATRVAAGPSAAPPVAALASGRQGEPQSELNDRQRRHLEALIERHGRRTARSKALTQKYRGVLADSRATVGFRPRFKEMLYPLSRGRAAGSRVWDLDGNEYVDLTMGMGVHLFGHAPDFLRPVLEEQVRDGFELGPRSELAGEVATLLCGETGMERAAFTTSGTEAVMTAIRLARAATGRSLVALFAGSYHGHSDGTLIRGEEVDGEPRSYPVAPGVPAAAAGDVLVLDYGSERSLEILRRRRRELAAILVEPVQSRHPDLQPRSFLHELRRIADEGDAALVFDEMITGFRAHPGGAQAVFGVRADIATYGKVVGGGLPIGVVAGRAEYMDGIDGGEWSFGDDSSPRRETTFSGGTYMQHPLTLAAARAVLRHLADRGPELQEDLNRRTDRFVAGLNGFFDAEGLPLRIVHFSSLFRFRFAADAELLFYHLLEKGVYVWEWRNCFLSTAHTDEDLERVDAAVRESVEELREGGFLPRTPPPDVPAGAGAAPATEDPRLGFWGRRDAKPALYGPPEAAPEDAAVVEAVAEDAAAPPSPVDFSLYFFGSYDAAYRGDKYDLVFEAARFADRQGFTALWFPERHFHAFGGFSPNPSVLAAALARETERIELRAGSVVLPLHHPVRVAEEWALVDNLSRGRVAVSFASGWHPHDFVLAPEAFGRHQELMYENIETVRRLWRGESVELPDGTGRPVSVRLFPLPAPRDLATWITVVNNPETYRRAGELGSGVLTNLMAQTVDGLAKNLRIYRRALAEAGHPPSAGRVTVLLHTFVDADPEAARATAREPFHAYLASSVGLLKNMIDAQGLGVDLDRLDGQDREYLLDRVYARYVETSALIGSPETCVPIVERLRSIGVGEIACLVDFGVERRDVLASLPHLDALRRRFDEETPRAYPLTEEQRDLHTLMLLEPAASRAYNEPAVLRLSGPLSVPALAAALGRVVARHPALRTVFPAMGEAQEVLPAVTPELPLVDLSGGSEASRSREVRRLLGATQGRAFDLERGPVIRALLLRLAARSHLLAVTVHHLAADGRSLTLLTHEVLELYRHARQGQVPDLPAPFPYSRYVAWLAERRRGPGMADQESFWRAHLEGDLPVFEPPVDKSRPEVRSFRGRTQETWIGAGPAGGVEALGRRSGASRFMTLFAAFAVLLHRWTGRQDLVIGAPVTRRPMEGGDRLVGHCVDVMPVRSRFEGGRSFAGFLAGVRRSLLDAQEHGDYPFARLIRELRTPREIGRTPLVNAVVNLDHEVETTRIAGLEATSASPVVEHAKFELALHARRAGAGWLLALESSRDLFAATTTRRFLLHFQSLFEGLAESGAGEMALFALPLLTPAERQQLLREWNDTAVPEAGAPIHRLFERRAGASPEATAVVFGAKHSSYRGLNLRANRLARCLARRGAGPEARVGVRLERSAELIAVLLGTLKAGAAYVPLDPALPGERLAFMAGDSRLAVLVTRGRPGQGLRAVPRLSLELDRDEIERESAADLPLAVHAEQIAYAMYTSGSTGRPKAVAVPHRAVARLVVGSDYLRPGPGDRVAQASTVSFDAATFEIWGALANGATLVGLPIEDLLSPGKAAARLGRLRIGALFVTTALFNRLAADSPDALGEVEHLLFGGETVDPAAVRAALAASPPRRLLHVYGPTECTTFTTWFMARHAREAEDAVPIGRPIANTTVHVLDPAMGPPPLGSPGELFVGGPGLARGYLGRTALTAERFVPDPAAAAPGGRLYRTGDQVRLLPRGDVLFLGRRDRQIKLRGFRIELGEIEAALSSLPGVRQAVVLRRSQTGGGRLVAYVATGEETVPPAELARHLARQLARHLPDYMMPSSFVGLSALPLSPNGKVDRRALASLPLPGSAEEAAAEEAPRTPTEELVAAIWCEVLEKDRVGTRESFFQLGGHSLSAVRVLARVRELFGVEVTWRRLFEGPTVAELAAVVAEGRASATRGAPRPARLASRPDPLPLSFAQERLWFLDRLAPGSPVYNVPLALDLEGELLLEALGRSLTAAVERHEVLRTRFPETRGRAAQVVGPAAPVRPPVIDLSGLPGAPAGAERQKQSGREARRPFDLARGPVLRSLLLRLGPTRHRLILTLHHIVCDGGSLELLLSELATGYRAHREGGPALAPLPLQYADYALWQRGVLAGDSLAEALGYWRRRLADPPGVLELPLDRPRPARRSGRGSRFGRALPDGLRGELTALGGRLGATLFMVLLAAFDVLLYRLTGQKDLLVGVPLAGRRHRRLEPLVGFFVNLLVSRAAVRAGEAVAGLLSRIREDMLDAEAHLEVPFERLVEELRRDRDPGLTPLVQTVATFHRDPAGDLSWPGLESTSEWIGTGTAKFDLTLELEDSAPDLVVLTEYDAELFDRTTVERLWRAYARLLAALAAEPGKAVDELDLASRAERHQTLLEWNDAAETGEVFVVDRGLRPVPLAAHGELCRGGAGPGRDESGRPARIADRFVPHPWSALPGALLYRAGDRVRRLADGRLRFVSRLEPSEVHGSRAGSADRETHGESGAPSTATEELLAQIWAEVLELEQVGREDDFFDLGGHSLLAMFMLARVREVFSADLEVVTVFERPTVAGLAAEIDGARRDESVPPLVAGPPEEAPPLSFTQERFWFLDQMTRGTNTYSVPFAVELEGPLRVAALERFFADLVARHEVLRARFPSDGGRPVQRIGPWHGPPLPLVDLSALAAPARDRELERRVTEEALRPFDLERGPLMRNGLVRLARQRHALLLSFHHIVADGWSVAVLIREANAAYRAFAEGRRPSLPAPPVQYRDYARWQRDWLRGEALAAELGFWRGELGGEPPVLTLPGQRRARRGQPPLPATAGFALPPETAARLRELARRNEATLFMTLLAAWAALLGRYGREPRVVVGTVTANRGRAELESLIGCFVNTLALAVDLDGDPSFAELLSRVRRGTLAAYAHQELPFEKLVEAYNPDRGAPQPLFQAFFTLRGADLPAFDLPDLAVRPLGPPGEGQPGMMFDFALGMDASPAGLSAGLSYNAALYPRQLAERMMEDLRRTLETVPESEETRLSELPGAGAEERRSLEELAGTAPEASAVEYSEEERVARRRERLSKQLDRLSPAVRERFAKRLRAAKQGEERAPEIPRRDPAAPAPLSFAQERLWFLDRFNPGSPAYNMPFVVRLRGSLDARGLERALAEVVRRHEVLRTVFELEDERPVQRALPPEGDLLPRLDLRSLGSRAAAEARRLTAEEADWPFDLGRGPLLRCRLLSLPADTDRRDDHVLIFNLHHVVFDGWSTGILVREVGELYEAHVAGRPPALPEPPLQYADYAVWQQGWLAGERLAAELAYWRGKLDGAPPVLPVPTDYPRSTSRRFHGAGHAFRLPAELEASSAGLKQRRGATLFMVLLAAFKALLHRLTGVSDLVLGTPIAHRNRREIEGLIGFFVNTLVLRTDLGARPSFSTALDRVREATVEAYDHQDLPFEKLVEELRPERNVLHTPLFQVTFALEEGQGPQAMGGLDVEVGTQGSTIVKFDLTLSLERRAGELRGRFVYRSDLFDATTLGRWSGSFESLLRSALEDPGRRLSLLPLLSGAERHQLLEEWNDAGGARSEPACLHELFAEVVRRAPDRVAASFEGREVTYAELAARSHRLARRLRALGVATETRVAIVLEPSPELVESLLAVLQAGGLFLVLEPGSPRGRSAFMAEDAGVSVAVTREDLLAELPEVGARVVCLDRERAAIDALDADAFDADAFDADVPPPAAAGPSLAYLVYTSGSTGRPKGVMIAHRSIVALLQWIRRALPLSEGDRVLQRTSLAFDASIREIFWPLVCGARLILPRPGASKDPAYLVRTAIERQATVLVTVPTLLRALLREPAWEDCRGLRRLTCGGEPLPRELAEQALARSGLELANLYGPTEATVVSAFYRCRPGTRPAAGGWTPIGRSLPGTALHVADRRFRTAPAGIPGELAIGGVQVARGYVRRPGLTAETFVPDPFGGESGERLYRSGDLARRKADGNLEFLGRVDHQVKLRGFRIEPGEIEAALKEHGSVLDAVVAVRGAAPEEQRLVAYVVPRGETAPESRDLRTFLAERLPDYMVPSAFVALPALPLTGSGKVDRRALPAPEEADAPAAFAPPRTPAEGLVAEVWAEVLRKDRVGLDDSFFELGGHSLLATQVLSRVRHLFGVEVPLRALFDTPTVAGLAAAIEHARKAGAVSEAPPVAPVARPPEGLPLSFAQDRLWFLHQLEPLSAVYNVPLAASLAGEPDLAGLGASLSEVVRRHEALRTVFHAPEGTPLQVVRPAAPVPLPVVDLSGLPEAARDAAAAGLARAEATRSFDLERGPLLRAGVLRLEAGRHLLVVTLHHVVSDAWSLGIFAAELTALYEAATAGRPSPLPELEVQYADFAVWQRRWLAGEVLEAELAYWRGRLEGAPAQLELPADRPRPAVQSLAGASLGWTLSEPLSAAARDMGRRLGATLFMTLLAAFQALLARYTGQTDVSVGTPIAGRNRLETENLIGFFVNTLVLRCDLSGKPSFAGLLARVREGVLEAHAHQDLPFEKLVEELEPVRSLASTPLFQVMFGLENVPAGGAEPEGGPLEPLGLETGTAKFDLSLMASDGPRRIRGGLEYNRDLFDGSTARRLAAHFRNLLAGVLADPEQPLADVALLTPGERTQLVREWPGTADACRDDRTVTELFHEQADRTPDKVASVSARGALTFAGLRSRAGRLARRLPGPDRLVGLSTETGHDLLVGILGILESGNGFVPLDPRLPGERLAFMVEECEIEVLVTDRTRSFASSLEQVPCRDETSPAVEGAVAPADPDRLVYVIYTSGSTGRPKGVPLAHRALVPMLLWSRDYFGFGEATRALQTLSSSFDFGIFEYLTTVVLGGTLHFLPPADFGDPEATSRYAAERRINTLHGTPSFVVELAAAGVRFPDLEILHLGGEALAWEQARAVAAAVPEGCALYNGYGPTEAAVFSATFRLGAAGPRPAVPIGRASSSHRTYVADAAGRPAPLGVEGELRVSGLLARGYHLRPALTAEKFVPDAYGGAAGERLYRTGDRVRWLPTGDAEFLGRFDHQVKVRGFRVELGEIESAMRRHPGVADAVALARGDGVRQLVGYVVPRGPAVPETAELRSFLAERLPDYMVPTVFVTLAELPLTGSGKTDRRALPPPADADRRRSTVQVPPRNTTELALARIWQEVLEIEPLGVHDDFFALGGHSLLTLRLQRRIEKTWERRLPVASFFQAPTIARQAALLGRERAAVNGSLVALRETGSRTPIFCVHAAGGHVICYQALARSLGPEQPFYAFQSAGLEDGAEGPRNIDAMARAYLEEMRGVAPEGPYRLAGWSMGGLVALEMARRLGKDGHEVERLVLLDTHLANGRQAPPDGAELVASFALHLGFPPEHLPAPAELGDRDPLAALLERARELDVVPPDLTPEDVERLFRVFRRNVEAAHGYKPRRYRGPALLLTAADRPAGAGDPAAAWRRWIAGLESRAVPGNHFTMVAEPHVGAVAEQLLVA